MPLYPLALLRCRRIFIRFALSFAALALGLFQVQQARAGFTSAQGMTTPRSQHTATLLPNGKLLVAGGTDGTNILTSAELYDPTMGTWTPTGPMNTARDLHSATLLPNGKVLVVGGYDSNSPSLTSAELYDPNTGTWSYTTPPTGFHTQHTATLLANGKVLVAFGYPSNPEMYDPATGSWTPAGTPGTFREGHTATLLTNGTVLFVGGYDLNDNLVRTAELFNPSTMTWTTNGAGAPNVARCQHTATGLPNGKVLIAGGTDLTNYLSSGEIYDPAAGTWTLQTSLMSSGRGYGTATLLPNGTVLIAEGYDNYLAGGDIFDPTTGTFSTNGLGWPNAGRWLDTATLLPNGRVIIAGGIINNSASVSSSVDIFESVGGSWPGTGPLINQRYDHTATLLPNGKVLIAGGINTSALASMEIYDPASGTNSATGSLITARYHHTATLLPNGQVLLTGGTNSAGLLASAELYNPITMSNSAAGSMSVARYLQTATLMADGRILVVGGFGAAGAVTNVDIYNPASSTWTATGGLNTPRYQHTATLLPNGQVFVAGGNNGNPLATTELYNPATGQWTPSVSIFTVRYQHTATLLPNGKVLVAGGATVGASSSTASVVICDPVNGTASSTGQLLNGRYAHTATLLPDGKVMVVGGYQTQGLFSGPLSDVELYDPVAQGWLTISPLPLTTYRQTATLLPNGRVLVAGGVNGTLGSSSEYLFDVGLGFSNAWRPQITSVTSPVNVGGSVALAGFQFRGLSVGAAGTTKDSAADYPMVQLRSIESERTVFLLATNWSANSFASAPVTNFPPGYALATVFADGIPSTSAVTIVTAPATVMISNLFQFYDGTGKSASVSTVPPGLAVSVTYNGSNVAPTNAGSYAVVAMVTATNYQGETANVLQIENFGVDASHFQDATGIPPANWSQMFVAGAGFAFVKASEGLTGPDDPTMTTNLAGAAQAGLLAGVYHFAHPENRPTTNGAVQEADHFLSYAGSAIGPGWLRPVLDIETTSSNLTPSVMSDWVIAFSQEIINNRGAGAAPIVYCSQYFANFQFDSRLAGYALWIQASGGSNPAILPTNGFPSATGVFTNWSFWQYEAGAAGGISPIDLDIANGELGPLSAYRIPTLPGSPGITSMTSDSGGFHLSLTNVPGLYFSVVATTNLITPPPNWTPLGAALEISPGVYQFTDPQATNLPGRYYRVRWQ